MTFTPALIDENRPLELKGELPAEALALDDVGAKAEQPIGVELLIEKEEEDFHVTGWLTTTLTLLCGRCAIWIPWPIRAEVDLLFEGPHPASIDLTPFIREDILLELPLNAACQLSADGRCPVSGEFYQPRPEISGSLAGESVWEALSKIKPKE